MHRRRITISLFLLFYLAGCSSSSEEEGDASAVVLLEAEDVIIEGLSAGEGGESVRDGWEVTFDEYVISMGDVRLESSSGDSAASDDSVFAIDLTQLSPSGEPLWNLGSLPEGRFDFSYATRLEGAQRHASVNEDRFSQLLDAELTHWIAGTLTQEGGVSCPPAALAEVPDDATTSSQNEGGDPCYPAESIDFEFGLHAEARHGPCEIDGIPGVTTTSGATTTVAITIHGDHLFFNGFPEGDEGGISRLAQWLADCDLDLDGSVTEEELSSIAPSDLPELDDRFQLGGSPITPLENMMTYLTAQALTQAHFQGEGECALDGEAGAH